MTPISSARRTVRPVSADRRTKLRLRELCDEVLASWRVAAGGDVLTDAERREATRVLSNIAPLKR